MAAKAFSFATWDSSQSITIKAFLMQLRAGWDCGCASLQHSAACSVQYPLSKVRMMKRLEQRLQEAIELCMLRIGYCETERERLVARVTWRV